MIHKTWRESLFIVVAFAALVFTLAFCVISRGRILVGGNDTFMDFFNHITYVTNAKKVYQTTVQACFPPFSYLFYKFFNKILPPNSTAFQNPAGTTGLAYLMYTIHLVVAFTLLTAVMQRLLEERLGKNKTLWIIILLYLSYSFTAGAIERGNSALIVLLLLLSSIYLKDSNKPLYRELALLFIAFAAGFKIYPAVFGLEYIREKRYKEALRLIVYGCLVVFLPFSFFGGFDGFKDFISNQLWIHEMEKSRVSIFGLLSRFIPNAGHLNVIWLIISMLLFVMYWLASTPFQRYFVLSAMMAFIPKWSGSYTLIYFTIPLVLLLQGNGALNNVIDYVLTVVMSVGMANLCGLNYFGITAIFVHIYADYLALVLVLADIVFAMFRKGKIKKLS